MNSFSRLLTALAISLCVLTACKPALDTPANKVSASAPDTSGAPFTPADKPLQKQEPTSAPQEALNGEYSVLAVAQPAKAGNKVEVLEFFGYFCSHCKSFDPVITQWAKKNADKVVFKRVPVAFRDNMIAQQRMYYALEAMGKLESLHPKVFDELQVERRSLGTDEEILAFITRNGVDQAKFKQLYDSFIVQSQAKNASDLQASYQINSVPNIAIAGRFMTSAERALKRPGSEQTEAGGQAATLQIMDELVAKVLKERGAPAKPRR